MAWALVNGRVFDGTAIRDGLAVLIDGSRIAALIPAAEVPDDLFRHDLGGALLAPGYVDTQVNGGGGALFNAAPTVETITTIARAHRRFGTTAFLPTLVSDRLEVIERGIAAVDAAVAAGVPGVIGIHIEGPFLAAARKGIHDPALFQELSEGHLALLGSLRHGRTLVTLAAEHAAPVLIAALAERGVTVAIGHSDATYEQTRVAIAAGARGCTHLFNAMSPLTSREPGVVGAMLEDPSVWCPIIVDGAHVAPATLRVALRAKPADRVMLVTDAMPSVGSDATRFELYGQPIVVRDGVCMSADGTLAGAHLTMADAVANAVSMLSIPLEQALAMASRNPAAFLGMDNELGSITPGQRANLVALDASLRVVASWIDGISYFETMIQRTD